METARWNRIEELLQAALDLPPDQRPAFLTDACGSDRGLREDLDALLAGESDAAALSESPLAALRGPSASLTGRTIRHYRIEARIGAGGMGEVYRARDESLQRTVAIKALPAEVTDDEDRVRRFEQEALAASRLNHPNLITIYEILHDGDAHFIVTEHIEGRTLRQLLDRGAGVPPAALNVERALDITMQIAAALKAAHTAWIIHRDIKPENIMVRTDGLVKIVDFGIAKLNEEPPGPRSAGVVPAQAASNLTIPGAVLGTARYMSPEQARGDPLDGRTDLYSLGLVFYEMLAGERASPNHDAPNAPKDLQRIVRKLLRADRGERYSTAGELLHDLDRVKRRLANRTARRLLGLSALIVLALLASLGVAALLSVNEVWDERVLRDGHSAAARQAVFSPDGRVLVTCGEDGRVIVWDFARRERLATLAHPAHRVAYSPDGRWFATGGVDGTIVIWDARRRQPMRVLREHHGEIAGLSISPDATLLASASKEGRDILWETGTWRKLRTGTRGMSHGTHVFSPGLRQLVSSMLWTVYDMETGAEVASIPEMFANWIALSPDRTRVATLSPLGHVSFYRLSVPGDLRTPKLVASRRAHQDHGRSIAFSPDGRLIASAAENILLWDANTHQKVARFEHAAIVWSVSFSPDGRWLVSTHGDGAVMIWDVAERALVANLNEHAGAVRAVAFSPDGRRVASAGEDRTVTLWDLVGRKQAIFAAHETRVTALAFSSDGRELASADQESVVILWDLGTHRPRLTIRRPEPLPIYTLAWSPEERSLATSTALYSTADGRLLTDFYYTHSARYQIIYGAAFSPDGRRLACATTSGSVLLFDAKGRLLESRELPNTTQISLSFSRDGKWLVTGEDQGAVRLWSVEPLREIAVLGRHAARVKSVAFSPDGATVASAGDDKMIALWDVRRRKLLTRIGTHASPIYSIAFSPDGSRLASGEHDHSVRVYTRKRTLWGLTLR